MKKFSLFISIFLISACAGVSMSVGYTITEFINVGTYGKFKTTLSKDEFYQCLLYNETFTGTGTVLSDRSFDFVEQTYKNDQIIFRADNSMGMTNLMFIYNEGGSVTFVIQPRYGQREEIFNFYKINCS